MSSAPHCRQCWSEPARAKDEFCSDICAHRWAVRFERTAPTEPVIGNTDGGTVRSPYGAGGERINLQNSA